MAMVSLISAVFLTMGSPAQEASFLALAQQILDHLAERWPGRTLAISDVAGDPEHREGWTSQVRSLAAARGLETISPSADPGCTVPPATFPDAECYFPRPRDYVVVEFIKAETAGTEVRLTFRAFVQGDPTAGFVRADLRASFERNGTGEWVLREVTTPAE